MHQRLTVAALGVVGAVLVALGIASATVWRADDVLVATGHADGTTTLLAADAGVLSLANDSVTITAHAPDDGTVVIAVGRDTDVAGWVGTDAHTQITGLSSWHVLASSLVPPGGAAGAKDGSTTAPSDAATPGEAPPADAAAAAGAESSATGGAVAATAAPDPSTSDMWVAQTSGKGTASLSWSGQPGRWSLLIATTGDSAGAPTVQLAWPQTVRTPWLVPCVVVGGLLILVAAGTMLRRRLRAHGGLTVTWNAVESGETPVVTGDGAAAGGRESAADGEGSSAAPLTRRQLRERERTTPTPVVAPRLTVRRREPGTGSTPTVAPPPGAVGTPPSSAPASDDAPAGHASSTGGSSTGGFTPSAGWPPAPAAVRQAGAGSIPTPTPTPSPAAPSTAPRPSAGAATPYPAPSTGRSWTPVPSRSAAPVAPAPGSGAVPSDAATEKAPGTDTPGAGARADAWRRAWGFPGVEQDDAASDDGRER